MVPWIEVEGGTLNQFWRKVWEICLLKAGPQDLPGTQSWLIKAVFAYFSVSFVLATMNLSVGASLASAFVDVVLLLLASYVILWVKLTPDRWYQTATSMAAVSVVIGVFALPAAGLQAYLGTENSIVAFPVLILIGLIVWNLLIFAQIFKYALEVNIFIGALFSGFYMYLSLKVMNILFFQAD